jgi:glycosyltransferase involved in cell wall biosynthesis
MKPNKKLPKNTALVHDWFLSNSIGGSEKVTFTFDKFLLENFIEADIFSLIEDFSKNRKNIFDNRFIHTSFIQKIPFGKNNIQYFLPIIPFAIEQLDLSNYDLIISSSHLAAKGVLSSPDQLHISYIHTPMRYAWDQMNTYLKHSNLSKNGLEILIRLILFKLRQWDLASANRPDFLIANSNFTRRRIQKYWGLESEVIHPPVDTKRFIFNNSRENFYLSVNRLVPNKRVDLIIKAFNKLGLPLVIIGDGSEKQKLKKLANKNVKILGSQPNYVVEEMYSRCRGFVYAGIEDFGIAPLEAMASGAPVIAFAKGGVLDTVKCINKCSKGDPPTGLLFKKQTLSDIVDTISWYENNKIWRKFCSSDLNSFAQNFNEENFLEKIGLFINQKWDIFQKNKSIIHSNLN